MSYEKDYNIEYPGWKSINDIPLQTWRYYKNEFDEVDKLFKESVALTGKIPGLSPFQYTSKKNEIKILFKNISILWEYVDTLPGEITRLIDTPYYNKANQATHDLALIDSEKIQTKNTLNQTELRRKFYYKDVWDKDTKTWSSIKTYLDGGQEVLKKNLTFADFTGEKLGDVTTVKKLFTLYDADVIQNKAIESFAEISVANYIKIRDMTIETQYQNNQGLLDFLNANPGSAIAEINPETGVPTLVYNPEAHAQQIKALQELQKTLTEMKTETIPIDSGDKSFQEYKEYMKSITALGELDHALDSPARQFWANVVDYTPVVPIIFGAMKYNPITKQYMTDEEALNYQKMGILNTVLVLGGGIGLGIKTAGGIASKTLFKEVLTSTGKALIADGAVSLFSATMDEAGVPGWMQMAALVAMPGPEGFVKGHVA